MKLAPKTLLILSIIASGLVVVGINIYINIISIILATVSIVLTYIYKKTQSKWNIPLSLFAILGSLIWISFILL